MTLARPADSCNGARCGLCDECTDGTLHAEAWRAHALPAHRYLERAKADHKAEPPYIWTFDIDDTVTAAPQRYARLATALKAQGDHIVCVTGHGPIDTREALLDAIGFPYDQIIIVDPQPDGSGKAKALKALGSWFHFDNEVEFGPEIIKVCPVAFQYVEPPGDDHPKKDAKKAAKALKRSDAAQQGDIQ